MIDTPAKLYDTIKSDFNEIETKICLLHKPCKLSFLCSNPSNILVLNFDEVEHFYAKLEKRAPLPSVDAITYTRNNHLFCFVELKGWKNFVKHNKIPDVLYPSNMDRIIVEEKARNYNFQGKLNHSCNLCEKIADDSQIFRKIAIAYVIVSDIDAGKQAIDDFASNLSSLAMSSSIWSVCDKETIKNLQRVSGNVEKYYTHCQDFDDMMNKISCQ